MENNMNRRPMNGGNPQRNMQNNTRNSNNNGGSNNSNNNNTGNNANASCEELMRAIMEADFFAQDLKL